MNKRNDTDPRRLERMASGILRAKYRDGQSLSIAMQRANADAAEHARIDRDLAKAAKDQHEPERWDGLQ